MWKTKQLKIKALADFLVVFLLKIININSIPIVLGKATRQIPVAFK